MRRAAADALGLFLLALLLRLALLWLWPFDGLYGQDAFAYLRCAREISELDAWRVPCLEFYWPFGYPALAALFMKLLGGVAGAQWAALLAGAALAPLAYGITRLALPPATDEAARRRAALAAGMLAAVAAQAVVSSLVIMSDVPGLFWASVSVLCLLALDRTVTLPARSACLVGAAIGFGAAVASRWVFAGLALPLGSFLLWRLRGMRPVPWAGLAAALAALGALLAALVYQNLHSPGPVTQHAWVVGWDLRHAWQRGFDTPDGHFDYRLPPALFYAGPWWHPAFLPLLLLPFAATGLWSLRRQAAGWLLIGWVALIYLYLIGVPLENQRFGLAYLIPVLVFAGVGLFAGAGGRPRAWRPLLLALSAVVCAGFAWRAAGAMHAQVEQQRAAIAFLQAHAPAGATVISFGLSISLEHYTPFPIVDLYGQTPASLQARICGRSTLLYVDRDNLREQWRGHGPELLVEWLEQTLGTQPLGSQDRWQLYGVGRCAASVAAAPRASGARESRGHGSARPPA